MAAEVSLFSRARSSKPAPKKAVGFLDLPGELRNRVYHYYFQDTYRCEMAAKGYRFDQHTITGQSANGVTSQKETEEEKHVEPPIVVRVSRILGSRDPNRFLQTNWPGSLCALILVCKLVHSETLREFYHRVTLVFQAPRRINSFLGTASDLCLQNITKLHLHYVAYGEPQYAKDRTWLNKHSSAWKSTCKQTAEKLTGLQELEIWVHTSQPAPKFHLQVDWIKPLLRFRRLTTTPKIVNGRKHWKYRIPQPVLKKVTVHVDTDTSFLLDTNIPALSTVAVDLHKHFGRAISLAILGHSDREAMADFTAAWNGVHRRWRYHLGYGKIIW